MREIGKSGVQASAVGLGTWAIGGWMWGGTDEKRIDRRDPGIARCRRDADRYGAGLWARTLRGDRRQGTRGSPRQGGDRHEMRSRLAYAEGPAFLRSGRQAGAPLSRPRRDLPRGRAEPEAARHGLYRSLHHPLAGSDDADRGDRCGRSKDLQQSGKIRAIGASNVSRRNWKPIIAAGGLDAIQERFSMIDREIEDATSAADHGERHFDAELFVAGAGAALRHDRSGSRLFRRRPAQGQSAFLGRQPREGARLSRRRSGRSPRSMTPASHRRSSPGRWRSPA